MNEGSCSYIYPLLRVPLGRIFIQLVRLGFVVDHLKRMSLPSPCLKV